MIKLTCLLTMAVLLATNQCNSDSSQVKTAAGLGLAQTDGLKCAPYDPNGQDQDPMICPYRTFMDISNWYNSFKVALQDVVAPSATLRNGGVSLNLLDTNDHLETVGPIIRRYLDHEITKIQAMLDRTISIHEFLDKETREVTDVIMILLYPDHSVPADNYLGLLIKQHRFSGFINKFAQQFLSTILTRSNIRDLVGGLAAEQTAYYQALIQNYAAQGTVNTAFFSDLQTIQDELKAFRQGMDSNAPLVMSPTTPLQGGPAAMISFFSLLTIERADNESLQQEDLVHPALLSESSSVDTNDPNDCGALINGIDNCPGSFLPSINPCTDENDMLLTGQELINCRQKGNIPVENVTATDHPLQLDTDFWQLVAGDSYPDRVLLANDQYFHDQGQEGACTAYAMTHVVEEMAKTKNQNDDIAFDAKEFWNKYREPLDSKALGALSGHIFISKYSAVRAEVSAKNGLQSIDQDIEETTIADYDRVVHLRTIIKSLNLGYPIYFGSAVNKSWHSASRNNGNLSCGVSGNAGHAYAVVGYDKNHNGEPVFIIKNSWGKDWGDRGYGYLPIRCCNDKNYPGMYCTGYSLGVKTSQDTSQNFTYNTPPTNNKTPEPSNIPTPTPAPKPVPQPIDSDPSNSNAGGEIQYDANQIKLRYKDGFKTGRPSKKSEVRDLQRMLRCHGANTTIDGYYGNDTSAKVASFQETASFTINGRYVTQEQWDYLSQQGCTD